MVLDVDDGSSDLLVEAEVYVDGPAGTFSTPIPALTLRGMISSFFADISTGLRSGNGTRANIGCSNAASGTTQTTAGIYGTDGVKVGEVVLAVPAEGWVQLPVPFAVSGGTVAWRVTEGEVYCWAVVVDNTSNDGTILPRTTYIPAD